MVSKSKYQKKGDFYEMSGKDFFKEFPHMAKIFPLNLLHDKLVADPNYIVRVKSGKIEIGYTEDAWLIT